METIQRKNISLQILRGIAATTVMFLHVFQYLGIKPLGDFYISGQYSVDIFFILSGYLIYITTKPTTRTKSYFKKRCFRIYPMYITALILYLCFNIYVLNENYGIKILVQNFLMFPWDSYWSYNSLIVGVAWSTLFELNFYFLFFLIIFFKWNKRSIFLIIPLLFFLSYFLVKYEYVKDNIPFISLIISLWKTPYVYLFVIGCLVGEFYPKNILPKFSKGVYTLLLILSIILFFGAHSFKYNLFYSLFASSFLFVSFLIFENYYSLNIKNKLIKLMNYLGDISFSIYLLHILVIKALMICLHIDSFYLMIILTTIITLSLSVFTYEFIEKKFIALAKSDSKKIKQ